MREAYRELDWIKFVGVDPGTRMKTSIVIKKFGGIKGTVPEVGKPGTIKPEEGGD